jgi:hypothetical protein
MLQVFYLDISKIDLVLQLVFQMYVSCVLSAFRCMLQVLHLDVSKVDLVLHLCIHFSATSPPPRCLILSSRRRLGLYLSCFQSIWYMLNNNMSLCYAVMLVHILLTNYACQHVRTHGMEANLFIHTSVLLCDFIHA